MTRYPVLATRTALVSALMLALAACGGGSSGGGTKAGSTGVLKLGITDSPIDVAESVVVQFAGVELKPRDGEAFSVDFTNNGLPAPKTLDLLSLQGGKRAMLLDGAVVPAGEYEWMRLKVNVDPALPDSYVGIAGQQCEMRIPSGAETGLKLIRGFTVGVGTTTDMTIDFDLRKSVLAPPGQRTDPMLCGGQAYMLKPVLRVVDNLEVGSVAGRVDPALMANRACAAPESTNAGVVYLFGPYTTPTPVADDLDGSSADGADPIVTANVDKATFQYAIGFVPKGKYVVAYSCDRDDATVDADTDQSATPPPAVDEVVNFEPAVGRPIEVMAGQATQADFAPPPPAP